MKILTLNTWGNRGPEARRKVLIEAIRSLSPDIACLQEVTDPLLLTELSFPTCLYSEESGLAIGTVFQEISHRILTYRTLSPFESYPRQALMVQLELRGRPFGIVNTHLAWKAQDGSTRLAQVEELLQVVSKWGEEILLSGDFNAPPESPPIRRIMESGFLDLFSHLNPEDPGITWDNRNPFIQSHEVKFPDRRIDYLFLKPGTLKRARWISCEVACRNPTPKGLYPSDHYGVLAQWSLSSLQEGSPGQGTGGADP